MLLDEAIKRPMLAITTSYVLHQAWRRSRRVVGCVLLKNQLLSKIALMIFFCESVSLNKHSIVSVHITVNYTWYGLRFPIT